MRSALSSGRGTASRLRNNRGSILTAALAIVVLIFMIVTVTMGRVASSYTHVAMRHGQASALFLAEAGIRKAGTMLMSDRTYAGEKGTPLPTGTFDVSVTPEGDGFIARSTGYVNSAFNSRPKKTVQARITLTGSKGFRITQWKENP